MSRRRGQAAVEVALVVPILVTLLLGIIDVGYLYNKQLVLTDATREGARLGSLGEQTSQIQQDVLTYLQNSAYTPLPALSDIQVVLDSTMSQVQIHSAMPAFFSFSGPAITLAASTKMRLE
ncbi:MAG TPA: TadE family protein [Oscillatoriaceae cyanobacterium]